MLGTGNNAGGGVQNLFKSFGGFGTSSGSSVASSLSSLGGVTDAMGFTTTAGGTVFDSAGQVTKSGSDAQSALSLLNNASTAKSIYTTISSAIQGGFGGVMESLAPYYPALSVGAMYGASYYTGRLGDKLTGSNTYAGDVYGQIKDFSKMSTTDKAILGALSMIPGGSIIAGGLIGKTTKKLKDYGIQAYGTQSAEGTNLDQYQTIKTTKKSWFSSSSKTKTYYTDMDSQQQEAIRATFETYDYLLNQMGDLDTTFVAAGKYSKNTFMDAMNKSFISAFTNDTSMTSAIFLIQFNTEFL